MSARDYPPRHLSPEVPRRPVAAAIIAAIALLVMVGAGAGAVAAAIWAPEPAVWMTP